MSNRITLNGNVSSKELPSQNGTEVHATWNEFEWPDPQGFYIWSTTPVNVGINKTADSSDICIPAQVPVFINSIAPVDGVYKISVVRNTNATTDTGSFTAFVTPASLQ